MIGSSNLSFSTLGVPPGHADLPDLFRALAKHFCKDGIVEATSAVRGFVYDLFKQVITPNRLIDFSKRSPPVHKVDGTRSMPVHTFLTEGSRTGCSFELGRVTSFLYGKRDNGTGKVYRGMWITPVARPLPDRTDTLFVSPRDGTSTAGQNFFALGDWILYFSCAPRQSKTSMTPIGSVQGRHRRHRGRRVGARANSGNPLPCTSRASNVMRRAAYACPGTASHLHSAAVH